MKKNITIRKCDKNDLVGVVSLLKQLWPKRIIIIKDIKNTFNKAILSTNQYYFCAIDDKRIIGFGSFTIKNGLYAMGKVAILDELIVDEAYRKTGVARQLVNYMVDFAKKKKCVVIELECGSERKPAHRFYEKYGFEKGIGCFFSLDLV